HPNIPHKHPIYHFHLFGTTIYHQHLMPKLNTNYLLTQSIIQYLIHPKGPEPKHLLTPVMMMWSQEVFGFWAFGVDEVLGDGLDQEVFLVLSLGMRMTSLTESVKSA
ncbi:hypothetical protein HDU98_007765, partial [Podochytrium sp. JEL0797]